MKSKLLKYVLPSLVAWSTNREINRQAKNNDWRRLSESWTEIIDVKRISSLSEAVDNLYESEMRRKDTIESKATSLFEAIGFAASLVSIAIVFAERSPILFLSLIPLANLVLSGICSWHAIRLGQFYLPTLEGIKANLESPRIKQDAELKMRLITEKLVDTEMNTPTILMKSNWFTAALQHFLLGILLISVFFIVIII